MPCKADIRLVDRIVAEYGLSREQRRLLQGEMAKRKIGEDLLEEAVREVAREIRELYPGK